MAIKFTDRQQGILMFAAFTLPALIVWLTSPEPLMAETSLRILGVGVIGGIIAAIKEFADYKPKEVTA